jgi:hypothetical protein
MVIPERGGEYLRTIKTRISKKKMHESIKDPVTAEVKRVLIQS